MTLAGRKEERAMLNRLMRSSEAEFLALYGRRRVGKTFLIREHFKRQLCFELTGTRDAPLHDQLAEFHDALGRRSRKRREAPGSWREAFQQLGEHLRTLRGRGKRVIFLDELPWLAGPRSRFLPALDHFWNAELSRDPRNVLVICGSAASWMIAKVIDHKGGLHNRVTAHMRLEPFTLGESERYFASRRIKLTRYDQLTLAMVVGGVPHYLKEAQRGWSAAQVIDRTCFAKLGLLRGEFDRVYASLFAHSERHVMLVRRLAAHPHGLTRTELAKSYGSGGRLTQTLRELEEAGFVGVQEPFGNKRKDMLYRLIDEYSLFYLKWIEKRRASGRGTFLKKVGSPAWRAWSGYALESLAHKHVPQLKRAMGIAEVDTEVSGWIHRPNTTWPEGAQVDLLLDRADNVINLFEVKFSKGPFTITKAYARELRRKVETFEAVTGTRKNVFLSFLTVNGLTQNAYANELVQQSLTTDALFGEGL